MECRTINCCAVSAMGRRTWEPAVSKSRVSRLRPFMIRNRNSRKIVVRAIFVWRISKRANNDERYLASTDFTKPVPTSGCNRMDPVRSASIPCAIRPRKQRARSILKRASSPEWSYWSHTYDRADLKCVVTSVYCKQNVGFYMINAAVTDFSLISMTPCCSFKLHTSIGFFGG